MLSVEEYGVQQHIPLHSFRYMAKTVNHVEAGGSSSDSKLGKILRSLFMGEE